MSLRRYLADPQTCSNELGVDCGWFSVGNDQPITLAQHYPPVEQGGCPLSVGTSHKLPGQ